MNISPAGNYIPQVDRNHDHQLLVQLLPLQPSLTKKILVDFFSGLIETHIKPGRENSVTLSFFRSIPSLLTIYVLIRSYNTYKGTNWFKQYETAEEVFS